MWLEFNTCNDFVDGIHLSFAAFQISICIRKKLIHIFFVCLQTLWILCSMLCSHVAIMYSEFSKCCWVGTYHVKANFCFYNLLNAVNMVLSLTFF
jgi:hypothetical protein